MLNLFDYLTPLDNKRIENYISKYGIEDDYCGNETYLRYWAKCKKHLFHLLGGQLIYKFPFKSQKDRKIIESELAELLHGHPFICDYIGAVSQLSRDKENNGLNTDQIWALQRLTSVETFAEDEIWSPIKYRMSADKPMLQISRGMKPMRAIQKVINYFDMGEKMKDEFEDFRIKHSLIFNEKEVSGQMCLSIHPLDFMTMSDNASNWSSCMNWQNGGCYRVGTVEMMNSNNVICCYLESDKPFYFGNDDQTDDESWYWNNKKWRQLFYVTKEIAVNGKGYPYWNEDFSKTVLKKIKELTEKNLGKTYTYGIEPYRDMNHIGSLYRMELNQCWIRTKRTKKHNILFHTNAMYNDMFNDHHGPDRYFCYRNKVKKNTIIKYSGKSVCLCCGEVLDTETDIYGYYEGDYNDRYAEASALICWDCRDERVCNCCHNEDGFKKVYKVGKNTAYCEDCLEEKIRKCPDCGEPITIHNYFNDYWAKLTSEEVFQQDFYPDTEKNIIGDKEHPAAEPYCACLGCITKKQDIFKRTKPPIDKARKSYSWRNDCVYFLTKEVLDISSPYLERNLERFDVEELSYDTI